MDSTPRHHRWMHRTVRITIAVLISYCALSYVLAPFLWKRYENRHPALADAPRITHTASKIPGDPLNIALVGSENSLKRAMLAAGWDPADPITLKSSLEIAEDTVLRRTYDDAPVSNLYLWGRKQDLAFEKPVGPDPRERHHVRWWRSERLDDQGRPLWMGAVTFDRSVGLSHTTGQITHHIGPDIDAERDGLLADLEKAGWVQQVYWIDNFQEPPEGRNGGGDPWHTDGRLAVGVLNEQASAPQ